MSISENDGEDWSPPHTVVEKFYGKDVQLEAFGDTQICTWVDSGSATEGDTRDDMLYLSASQDGGRSWSPPVQLTGPVQMGYQLHVWENSVAVAVEENEHINGETIRRLVIRRAGL